MTVITPPALRRRDRRGAKYGGSPVNLFGRKSSPAAAAPVAAPVEETAPSADAAPADSLPADIAPADAAPAPVDEAPAEPPAAAPAAAIMSTAARLAFLDKGPAMTSTTPKPPAGSLLTGAARTDQAPRRMLDTPAGMGGNSMGARRADSGMAPLADVVPPPPIVAAPTAEPQRRLTVGRDISLAGEIASCDVLVVEGTVEAKLRDGHSIEVTETGLFKGSVEIDDADIGGRFEGDIVVRNRLRVRSSGRIIGSIVYGELEVETGGQLVGSIKLYDPAPKAAVIAPTTESADAAAAPQIDVQPAQVYTPTATYPG